MKHTIKSALLIGILSCCISSLFAQKFKDVFSPDNTITYLGIDFTNVRVIGHTDIEVSDLVEKHFSAINQLVLNEPKKYDLPKAFHKGGMPMDISFVSAKNKKIDYTKIISYNTGDEKRLTDADIEKIVKGYDFDDKKGFGFMFIMESMSKTSERAAMYLTFIDMASRKVLYSERMTQKSGGFGLRNYWAKPIYEALNDIEKDKYKEWRQTN